MTLVLQTIRCDLEFEQPLKADRLNINGSVENPGRGMMVNNANLTKLDQDAIRLHGRSYVVRGGKIFTSMLNVEDMRIEGGCIKCWIWGIIRLMLFLYLARGEQM